MFWIKMYFFFVKYIIGNIAIQQAACWNSYTVIVFN